MAWGAFVQASQLPIPMQVEVGEVPRGKGGTVFGKRGQEAAQIRTTDAHICSCKSCLYLPPLVAQEELHIKEFKLG